MNALDGLAERPLNRLLKMAVLAGVETAVRIHIRRGDNLDARDAAGMTPLMLAASKNKASICVLLLSSGVDASLKDPSGRDALEIAAASGAADAVSVLSVPDPEPEQLEKADAVFPEDNGVAISDCGAVPLRGTGNSKTAQCVGTTFGVGTHPLTAAYAGSTTNLASSSGPVSEVVNAGPTTTSVASSLNPAPYSTNLIFTATVTGQALSGTVAFKDNGVVLSGCGAINLSGTSTTTKTAVCPVVALPAGSHPITAAYAGATGNLASTSSTLAQTVSKVATTTAVYSSRNPARAGTVVTYTAVVTGKLPFGTVAFTDNGVTIAACAAVSLPGNANAKNATCNYTTTAKGAHVIAGRYVGDANNLTSSGAMTETIN